MSTDFKRFLSSPEQDRKDAFEKASRRLITSSNYIEKIFGSVLSWTCFSTNFRMGILGFFSKAAHPFQEPSILIDQFSEDVGFVVYREDLGFDEERCPTMPKEKGLSNSKRKAFFEKFNEACENYIHGDLADALGPLVGEQCRIVPDDQDPDRQTLLVEYPTLYTARSALGPNVTVTVEPYVAEELGGS